LDTETFGLDEIRCPGRMHAQDINDRRWENELQADLKSNLNEHAVAYHLSIARAEAYALSKG
jgi:hypothetical protein